MNAKTARTAKQRAQVAIRLIKTIKPWPIGFGLGSNRGFDDCFEMFDGHEVVAILKDKARRDPSLLAAMKVHKDQCGHWVAELEAESTS